MTDITSDVRTALSAQPYRPARFVKIEFPGTTVLLWSGVGPKTVNGDIYTGAGDLGSISTIADTSSDGVRGADSQRLELVLSGLNASLAVELRDFQHQGSPVTITEAQLDASGDIVDDPYVVFVGQVDTMQYLLGETLTIKIQVENFLSYMFRGPDGRRRGDADQQNLFSGDLAFQFAGVLQDSIPWGVETPRPRPRFVILPGGIPFPLPIPRSSLS